MKLQPRLKSDLKTAIKEKDDVRKETIRVVMGEFARMDKKELSDAEVIGIMKKLIKSEKELIARSGADTDSAFIRIIEAYLPQMATDDEIRAWIAANIDFSEFRNKMQAMRPIMQHFGANADGNRVKAILQAL